MNEATFIYLCEHCDHEVATTSTAAGPFEAPPSVFCACTGELREMDPMPVDEGDSLAVSFATDGGETPDSQNADSDRSGGDAER